MSVLLRLLILSGISLFIFVPTTEAINIYDNGGPDYDNPLTYSAASNVSGSEPDFQQMGNKFILNAGQNGITDIHWWGGYSGGVPASDSFDIKFFGFIDGSPSSTPMITLMGITGVNRVDTGTKLGFYNEEVFSYFIDLGTPITLTAGVPYLLSIVREYQEDSIYWGWVPSAKDGIASYSFADHDNSWAGPLNGPPLGEAFFLTGPAPVPEPSAILLLGSSLLGLVGLRRTFKK